MRWALILTGFLLVLCLAVWLAVAGQGESQPLGSQASSTAASALREDLVALQAELAEERLARRILESEVDLMREVLLEFGEEIALSGADVDGSGGDLAGPASASDALDPANEGEPGADDGTGAPPGIELAAEPAGKRDPVFQLDTLVASGVGLLEAERVRDVWYQIELDKLELRDRAIREGWLNSKRFQRQLQKIKRDAVEELGECGYDSLLYGTGSNNRVIVRDVLAGSTAERAGVRTGDVVLRYNNNRIWAATDLQSATARGERGETVMVDIDRNGERVYVQVERGPFGMFMRQGRAAPDGC